MSNVLMHGMNTAWSSSAAALAVTVDILAPPGAAGGSNHFVAATGALNATASLNPPPPPSPTPLDLTAYDEIRFWILADRAADGSVQAPFYLELFYVDASAPTTESRWFVPVNRSRQWEQRVIGFRNTEPRGSVTQIAFRAITSLPFSCHVAELLGVREEMLPDAELSLTDGIRRDSELPGLTNIALVVPPATNATQVVVVHTPEFAVGQRLRLTGGSLGDEFFHVQQVTHAPSVNPPTTTLVFEPGERIAGTFAGPATISAVVAVIVETSASPAVPRDPSVVVTMLEAREDLGRTGYFPQRDSFRTAGAVTVCSVRPAPRAYALEYQLTVAGAVRAQQLFVHTLLLQRFSMDIGLRINGDLAPVAIHPPPELRRRRLGELAPVYLCIGTHLQTAPRREQTWVRHAEVRAAPLDAPLDWERVEVDL